MKTGTTTERLFALCSIALILAGIGLFFARHPWLGGTALYVGATMFVLTFIRCASIASRRTDDDGTA